MAKKAYIGVNGIARKITKGYIGVGGIARKIKKAYIGIGGVARPCFSSHITSYWGELTYPETRNYSGAGVINNHALFAGGKSGDNYLSTVLTYDTSLTPKYADDLSEARYYMGVATSNDRLFFGGGCIKSSSYGSSTCDAYNSSLSRTRLETLQNVCEEPIGAGSQSFGFIAGGTYITQMSTVSAYSSNSTTRHNAPNLSTATKATSTVGINNLGSRAVFVDQDFVDAYDDSLTKTVGTLPKTPRNYISATVFNGGAILAGGLINDGTFAGIECSDVDYMNTSLTCSSLEPLTYENYHVGATTLGDYVLLGGKRGNIISETKTQLEAYDKNFTKVLGSDDYYVKYTIFYSALSIGNYALFNEFDRTKVFELTNN